MQQALRARFSVILKSDLRTRLGLTNGVKKMTDPRLSRNLAIAMAVTLCMPVLAQERIYRCGNEYTNDAEVARSRGCKPMEGGNITIIQGTAPRNAEARPPTAPRPTTSSPATRSSSERVDSSEQRARDSDARSILESELRKAQERLEQATKAYANGSPEKEGIESRNHQRYLDRVAELKASVARAESDVTSIQRELARMGGKPAGAAQ